MLNEIVQVLSATNIAVIIGFGVFLVVGFSRLVYKLRKLSQHICFAKQYRAKYIQVADDNERNDGKGELHLWLIDHLYQIKQEMKKHGDGNYHNVGITVRQLHNLPFVLGPNLADVVVDLTEYIGRLRTLRKQLLKWTWCPIVWLLEFVEIVCLILRVGRPFGLISGDDRRPKSQTTTAGVVLLLTVYGAIADWDGGFVKTFTKIMKIIQFN